MAAERQNPERLLEDMERDTTASPHTWADVFLHLAELYRKLGDDASAEVMDSLHLAFGAVSAVELERFSGDKPRFILRIYFEDAPPPIKNILTPQRCQHLRWFLERTENPAMRARLFDLLWVVDKDHVAARDAADAYLDYASACAGSQDPGACLAVADGLLRSLEISLQIGDADRLQLALERALHAARTAIAAGTPRNAFELIRELLACKAIRNQLPLDELRELIERAMQQLDGDPLQQRHWERMWLGNMERLGHVTRDLELVRAARIRVGQSLEQTGDFWVEHGSHLPAIPSYQRAVAAYKAAGRCPDRVEAALRKLESAVRSSKGEMKRIEVQAEIPREVMEKCHAEVVSIYKDAGLAVLADSRYALPDVGQIRAKAAEAQQHSPVLSLFPAAVLQEDRIVRGAVSKEEHLALETAQWLRRELSFKLGHLTAWVFEAIREEGSTVRGKVMELVSQSGVVAEWRHALVDLGLERYEAGDYASSIHILVFQIEGILRDFARLIGLPVTVERDGETQARLLSDLLHDERLGQVLGEALTESLKALLVDRAGPNIRNVIAHGMAAPEAFTEEIANLLVALLLQVSAFGPVNSEAPEETPPDAPEGGCGGPEGEPVR